jgi:RNA polymerase sigma-70 factor, ECF subfamily
MHDAGADGPVRLIPKEDHEVRLAFARYGDRVAFDTLVRPHLDTVFTLCIRMTNERGEAEDVAQEALIRALKRHHLYDPSLPFRPWMLTVAANLCRSRLRSPWFRRRRPILEFTGVTEGTPEQAMSDSDRDSKIRRALDTVPQPYREALSLFHLDDMSYVEMATITGVGVSALKQRVRRGNDLLRSAVERMYPELSLDRKRADEP